MFFDILYKKLYNKNIFVKTVGNMFIKSILNKPYKNIIRGGKGDAKRNNRVSK